LESTSRRAISVASSGFDPALAKIADTSRRKGSAWIWGIGSFFADAWGAARIVPATAGAANPLRIAWECCRRRCPPPPTHRSA
jgi:hypothetical protein